MSETTELPRFTEQGWRVQETDDYVVDVWPMLFNYRVVVHPNDGQVVWHGYCYFGKDLATLLRAIAAATAWKDPMNTAPEGFDKQAF